MRVPAPFALLSLLLLPFATAAADVDVEVGAALRVRGTLLPEGEVEAFTFEGTEGEVVTLRVRAGRGTDLDLGVRLLGPGDEDVTPGEPFLRDTGTGVDLRKFPLPSSGPFRVEVSGEGTGEYALSLKGKAARKAGGTLEVSEGAEFAFAAPAGSTLKITAKAAKGSGASPRLGLLLSDGDPVDLSGEGKRTATLHAVLVPALQVGGDLLLTVGNEGTAGDVAVSVKVKPPRVPKEKLDLRGSMLGRSGGGETFVGRTVGPAGGTVAASGAGDLAGASVVIPPGALSAPTRIVLASAGPLAPPSDGDQPSGPAVDLRPSGILFDVPVSVTLPYDLARIPADAAPGDLRVLVREDDGSSLELLPTAVDEEAGTVTVAAGGFSICIPIVEAGPPRLGISPGGDEYWALVLELEHHAEGNGDSRTRTLGLSVGEVSFFPGNRVQFSLEKRGTDFSNPDDPGGTGVVGSVFASTRPEDFTVDWAYNPDRRSFTLDGDPTLVWFPSRDGSAMVFRGDAPGDDAVTAGLMLRKPAVRPTLGSTAGTWIAGGMEISVNLGGGGGGGPADPKASRQFGTLILDGRGGGRIALRHRESQLNPSTGKFSEDSETFSSSCTAEMEPEGTLLLRFPPEGPGDQGDVLRLYPGRDGRAAFMVDASHCGSCVFAVALVRQESGLGTAVLAGEALAQILEVSPESYGVGGPPAFPVADYEAIRSEVAFGFGGGATATVDGRERSVRRNPSAPGGVSSADSTHQGTVSVSVDRKGVLTVADPGEIVFKGAVTADGMFGFLVTDPAVAGQEFGLGFFVRPPPAREP